MRSPPTLVPCWSEGTPSTKWVTDEVTSAELSKQEWLLPAWIPSFSLRRLCSLCSAILHMWCQKHRKRIYICMPTTPKGIFIHLWEENLLDEPDKGIQKSLAMFYDVENEFKGGRFTSAGIWRALCERACKLFVLILAERILLKSETAASQTCQNIFWILA